MRKPRILWANHYCLLDTSSGASISVRQILMQLQSRGFEIEILGATIFDSPRGALKIAKFLEEARKERMVKFKDGDLIHSLVTTQDTTSKKMTAEEIANWAAAYQQTLAKFKPDLVIYYGGKPHDYNIPAEAHARNIPTAFYLANGNYHGHRWARDIDLVLTDTQATANMYKERLGYNITPIGKYISHDKIYQGKHSRKNLLFVNPVPAKGGLVMVVLAKMLQEQRPDIPLEVVESRGRWSDVVTRFSEAIKEDLELPNVTVTPNTGDMRPIFGRARLLISPSLWWESGGRVLAEAMLNGIPAIITDRGGMPEMIGDAGFKVKFPKSCHESPYTEVPVSTALQPIIDKIIQLYDDEELYQSYVSKAVRVGKERHDIEKNTDHLIEVLTPYLDQKAGDGDFQAAMIKAHKQL